MSDAIPGIKSIKVKPEQLILDPSNPRTVNYFDKEISRKEYSSYEIQKEMEEILEKEFKVDELVTSIGTKGFFPVDSIFVETLGSQNSQKIYLVLEGNRRTTAIKILLRKLRGKGKNNREFVAGLEKQLSEIEVKLIPTDDGLESNKIRLLGMRHHGSQKKWTPFARAKDAFIKYLESAEMDPDEFKWDSKVAEKLAESLTIRPQDLEKMLRIFVAMRQLHQYGANSPNKFEIKDRYYSLIEEVVVKSGLVEYFPRDETSFELDQTSLEKLQKLCRFDDRTKSPIKRPSEWRPFANIVLNKNDLQAQEQREVNINRVYEGELPSVVWRDLMAEVNPPGWQKWFNEVYAVLAEPSMGELPGPENPEEFEDAADLIRQLDTVLRKL